MNLPLIYHGTPITPAAALDQFAGRAFCVSFYRPDCVDQVERISPLIMYDNGAFSFFTRANRLGVPREDRGGWMDYYSWLEPRLFQPGRWAVIPDEIDAGSQLQDALLAEWPFGHRGAPVWHTDEPADRLLRLLDSWPRVCIGSSGEHWKVGSDIWRARMDEVWGLITRRHRQPTIHMLRGVAVATAYPFASADSTSLGQNSHRYRMPLFRGTPGEWSGLLAYADKLERRRA